MLSKLKKKEIVKELTDKFNRKKIAIFCDFHGISVAKSQVLRRALKQSDAEYKVAKKTLLDRALGDAGVQLKTKGLPGEMAVAFGYDDVVSPAKALVKFAKANETFKIVSGIFGVRLLNQKDILALAKLPSKEILYAQVLGALTAPLRGLAQALQGNIRNLVVVLSKINK